MCNVKFNSVDSTILLFIISFIMLFIISYGAFIIFILKVILFLMPKLNINFMSQVLIIILAIFKLLILMLLELKVKFIWYTFDNCSIIFVIKSVVNIFFEFIYNVVSYNLSFLFML